MRELNDADRAWLLHFPETCDEDVSRKGESQPCEKPAVAARFDPTFGGVYAVCAYHSRADMVPLVDLLNARRPLAAVVGVVAVQAEESE